MMMMGTGQELLKPFLTSTRIVRRQYYNRDNNELVELSGLRYKEREVCAFVEPGVLAE